MLTNISLNLVIWNSKMVGLSWTMAPFSLPSVLRFQRVSRCKQRDNTKVSNDLLVTGEAYDWWFGWHLVETQRYVLN